MSDAINPTAIYRAPANPELTDAARTDDILGMVSLCVSRDQPVRVSPLPEPQPLSDQIGPVLLFFSPLGTSFHFGDDLVDRDGFATTLYDGGGLFLSIDTDGKPFIPPIPVPQCSSGFPADFVSVTDVDDFDRQRAGGAFGNAPAPALDAARIHLAASCGEEAKCPGTLGPICR